MPLVRLPLEALRQRVRTTLTLRTPDGPQWRRIRAHWGDPGIMVFVALDGTHVHEWTSLGIEVNPTTGDGRPLQAAPTIRRVYTRDLVPPDRHGNTGLLIEVAPGEQVVLTLVAREPQRLPTGELVAKYEWGLGQKDHLVELQVQELGAWVRATGVLLLAAGGLLCVFRRVSAD